MDINQVLKDASKEIELANSQADIDERVKTAAQELAAIGLYDYVIITSNIEESVQDMFKAGFAAEIKLTEEELMIGELARLQTLMMLYENKEEYEKAAVLLKKVNDIKKRLR